MKSDKKELVKKKVKVKSVTRENCQSERKICKKSKVRKLIEQKSKNVEESLRMGQILNRKKGKKAGKEIQAGHGK